MVPLAFKRICQIWPDWLRFSRQQSDVLYTKKAAQANEQFDSANRCKERMPRSW